MIAKIARERLISQQQADNVTQLLHIPAALLCKLHVAFELAGIAYRTQSDVQLFEQIGRVGSVEHVFTLAALANRVGGQYVGRFIVCDV